MSFQECKDQTRRRHKMPKVPLESFLGRTTFDYTRGGKGVSVATIRHLSTTTFLLLLLSLGADMQTLLLFLPT